jgi:hypothetical protein
MHVLTQQKKQNRFGVHPSFDSKSRTDFFRMREVALVNLSIIERDEIMEKVLQKK